MKTVQEERDHFRKKLYQFQQEQNLSEYALSHGLGKCDSYIQSISSGKNMPSFTAFIELCHFLKKEPEEFFEQETSDLRENCIRILKNLPEDKLSEVLRFLKFAEE